MRILLIEDSKEKVKSVSEVLARLHHGVSPTVVDTLADAMRTAMSLQFDLIILDLMIPYMRNVPPSSDAGYEFIRQMRSGGPNATTKVISISAFPDEVQAYRSRFDQLGVLITALDDEGVWQGALKGAIAEISGSGSQVDPMDFLIVCALDEERQGFAATSMERISEASVRGLNIQLVKLGGFVGALVRLSQMGLVTATYEVAGAIELFDPKILAMSGICAGVQGKSKIGQLVAASLAWEYQAGKWSKDGFEIAPMQVPIPATTRGEIDFVLGQEGVAQRIDEQARNSSPRPTTLVQPLIGPMASGSAVIAEQQRIEHIKVQHRKVVALDMETFGLFYSAHESRGRLEHFFCVKAVVDLADEDKDDDFHEYGSRASAIAVTNILERILA